MKFQWSAIIFSVSICVVILSFDTTAAEQKKIEFGSVTPYDLRVEYLVDPSGIDEPNPRFSWKLASEDPGDAQTAYRIVVYPAPRKSEMPGGVLPPVWDSKEVKSGQSVNIEYAGEPLRPTTDYRWLLKVKDSRGRESDSCEGSFSTGLFPTSDCPQPWKGDWIGLDPVDSDSHQIDLARANWIWTSAGADRKAKVGKAGFRKTFRLPDAEPTFAKLVFTGDNKAVVYVNGKKVSESMSPVNGLIEDIKSFIKPGKNVVALVVENYGVAPNAAGAIAKLLFKYPDRKDIEVTTDATWKGSDGISNGTSSIGFDDSSWNNAVVTGPVGCDPWKKVSVSTKRIDIPARYLLRGFGTGKSAVVRATAYISGLGYYELYLNGQKVGDHCLDPVLHDYDVRVPYVTYDLTDLLRGGGKKNVVGAIIGSGRYYAPRYYSPTGTRTYGYPKLLFQLEIEYADGTKQLVKSDSNWKLTANGPIVANNDYDGEIYDARKELRNWSSPDYDDSDWEPAQKVDPPKGRLRAQMMPPMRVTDTIRPISLNEVRPGVWIYDLGQNMVGWCRLKVEAPAGTEIRLRHAETLDPDGSGELYVKNLRGARCRDIYTTAGSGVEVYEPRFTYHGFRYVELTGFPGQPDLDTITGRVVNTDLPQVGRFKCSSDIINRIYRNIVWGVRGNYLSIPTDCPQRDERQGWQGDRAGESKGEMYIFDNVTLYSKWLDDIEDSQTPNGNLSDVCPSFWPLYGSNVTWPSAFTIIPKSIYLQYGDSRPIRRHYGAMVRWMDHLATFIEDDLIDKDNYGDWCVPPEKPELIHSQDPARKTSKAVLATCYYVHNLNLLSRYAEMLGKTADAKKFRAKAAVMTKAFNDKFYDPATGKYDNATQTACVLPLRFDLVPEGESKKVFNELVRNIEEVTDNHIGTGLIGGQWLNQVLSDHGRADISYRFATNTDYPSWGYMVKKGATTIWELWNGDTANPEMNSGNHVMLVGDLTIWLYEYLAGIASDPESPGFERIVMKPHPVGDLAFVNCRYDSVRGPIESDWRRDGGKFHWEITVPVGSTARIFVPTTKQDSVRESGNTDFAKRGIRPVEFKDGRAVFDIGSGLY